MLSEPRYPSLRWKIDSLHSLERRFGETYCDCQKAWNTSCQRFMDKYKETERLIRDLPRTAGWMSRELAEYKFWVNMDLLKRIEENELYEWVEG